MSLLNPKLEAFIAVAKFKTIHAAASAIYITQTAVTHRIKALETSLKTTLFIRTQKGMRLTSEGNALVRYCQAAKEIEDTALLEIQGDNNQIESQLCISSGTSMMHSRVVPQCLNIVARFPNLLLHFDVNDIENRHKSLKSGYCDIAIVRQEVLAEGMQHKKLAPEEHVLVCSQKWKGRKLQDIVKNERIIDFDPSDQFTYDYLKHYDLFDLVQHQRHFINRTGSLAMMIKAGLGYSSLAKEFAKPYFADQSLMVLNAGKTYDVIPFLAWYHRPKPPAYFSAIVDAIQ